MKFLKIAPRNRPALAGILLCMSVLLPAHSSHAQEMRQWPLELTVGHFIIHSDFQLLDKQALATQLIGVTRQVEQLLKISTGGDKVHVVLFETQEEYRKYMQNYFPDLPMRRALFIQDQGPGMLFAHWHSDIATDLRHEVSHAVVNASNGEIPLWVDEGIAEYFEVESQKRFRGSQHLPDVVRRSACGFVPQLSSLERIAALGRFSTAHYRDSWSWIHYMLHRNDRTRQLLVRYLAECRSGAKPLHLERQLSLVVGDVAQDYREHFSHFQHTATKAAQTQDNALDIGL